MPGFSSSAMSAQATLAQTGFAQQGSDHGIAIAAHFDDPAGDIDAVRFILVAVLGRGGIVQRLLELRVPAELALGRIDKTLVVAGHGE